MSRNKSYFVGVLIFLSSMMLVFVMSQKVYAVDYVVNKVVASCDLPSEVMDYDLDTTVHIEFLDPQLYNPGVKLSYKIYDQEMEVISSENKRYDLNLFDGATDVLVTIDLKDYGISDGDNVIVKFDLVDETNVFWFSDNPYVDFEAPEVHINYNFWHDVRTTYTRLVTRQFIQLIINLIGFAFVIFGLRQLYKNVLNSMK